MSGDDHVSLLCSLIKVVTSGGLQQYFESFMHSQLIFGLLEKLFYGAYIEIFLVDKAYFQCINVFLASKLGLADIFCMKQYVAIPVVCPL